MQLLKYFINKILISLTSGFTVQQLNKRTEIRPSATEEPHIAYTFKEHKKQDFIISVHERIAKSAVFLTGGRNLLCVCRKFAGMYAPPDPCHLTAIDSKLGNRKVDLRSDTLTVPTELMRKAAFEARVGDDVLGEDPTVNSLQERVAKMLEKEDALFVTSGTMGNLISIIAHCEQRGQYALVGDKSHILHHEGGGAAELGGVMVYTVPSDDDGMFNLADVEERMDRLVCVENTFNGRVLPIKYLQDISALVRGRGGILHMDGARIFNAAVKLGVPVETIVKYADSVTFCFSKGLGCPVGSIITGTKSFIQRARRLRHVLGGQMRQVGVLAAYAHVALDCMIDRLAEDHRRMEKVAKVIQGAGSPNITSKYTAMDTNMAMIHINPQCGTGEDLRKRLATVTENELQLLGESATSIQCYALDKQSVRFVAYNGITDGDISLVETKLKYVISEYDQKGFQK